MRQKILIGLVMAVAVVAGVIAAMAGRQPVRYHGTHLAPPMPAAEFTLHAADGPVSLSELRGRAVVLFFGYTGCPDVCPTTMLRLGEVVSALGDDGERVQVLFVTVDPERDTPQRADRYAKAIDPSFLGLSGSPEEIAEVARLYGIYYAKADGTEATGYLVDHTATVTVLDPEGRVALLWSHDVEAPAMTEDLRTLLRS